LRAEEPVLFEGATNLFFRRRHDTERAVDEIVGLRVHDSWSESQAANALVSWPAFNAAAIAFGLTVRYTRADIEVAFRRLARKAHPDVGGTHEAFRTLLAQRELLLNHTATQRLED
jgi:hypothetical protein